MKISKIIKKNKSAIIYSGASQVVNSLTNFVSVIYLLKVLSKQDFGVYTIGFSICVIISSLITSCISAQYVVNNPYQPVGKRESYAMHHLLLVTFFVILLMIVILTSRFLLELCDIFLSTVASTIFDMRYPIICTILGMSTRDILTRIAHVRHAETLVFGSSLISAVMISIAFALVSMSTLVIESGKALEIIALGQIFGVIYLIFKLKFPWSDISLIELANAFSISWNGGRWNALSTLIYNIRSQIHNFIIVPLISLQVLADVNAARSLLTPAIMTIAPLYQIIVPRLSEKGPLSVDEFKKITWTIACGFGGFAILYSLILLMSINWVLPILAGENYISVTNLVMAWCVFSVINAARNGLSIGLEVKRYYREILYSNILSAVIAIVLAFYLALNFGGLGTIMAICLAELTACIVQNFYIKNWTKPSIES